MKGIGYSVSQEAFCQSPSVIEGSTAGRMRYASEFPLVAGNEAEGSGRKCVFTTSKAGSVVVWMSCRTSYSACISGRRRTLMTTRFLRRAARSGVGERAASSKDWRGRQ